MQIKNAIVVWGNLYYLQGRTVITQWCKLLHLESEIEGNLYRLKTSPSDLDPDLVYTKADGKIAGGFKWKPKSNPAEASRSITIDLKGNKENGCTYEFAIMEITWRRQFCPGYHHMTSCGHSVFPFFPVRSSLISNKLRWFVIFTSLLL